MSLSPLLLLLLLPPWLSAFADPKERKDELRKGPSRTLPSSRQMKIPFPANSFFKLHTPSSNNLLLLNFIILSFSIGTRIPTLRPATMGRLILHPPWEAILRPIRMDTRPTSKTATHLRGRRTTTTTITTILLRRRLLPTITTKRTLDALLSYADVMIDELFKSAGVMAFNSNRIIFIEM
ncbi:hypothetical protein ACLOJK_019085 [Asimina triloba]